MEKALTKNQILNELTKSPHGKLEEYLAVGQQATREDPEFMAHLIAFNREHGQIRDSKVALPIITLSVPEFPAELISNSLAHVVSLDPRNMVRALRFAKQIKSGRVRLLHGTVKRYLYNLQHNRSQWERVAIMHRASLQTLYTFPYTGGRIKQRSMVKALLEHNYTKDSLFDSIRNLRDMAPQEAAGTIMRLNLPSLVVRGAVGAKLKDPDVIMAVIGRMTPTELVTASTMLEDIGIKNNPALRAAYDQALGKAASSTKNVLKASRKAAEVKDESMKAKLHTLQEKQLRSLGGIDGNWLVLGDKSGSMQKAIEFARYVAATLAKMVTGQVHLVYFDTSPRYINATGKSYEDLLAETKTITAVGGTSIGCGLQYIMDKKIDVDGIAIVSDGAENSAPFFSVVYPKYSKYLDKEPTVYVYLTKGESPVIDTALKTAQIDFQMFDLRHDKADHYSIPEIAKTMQTSRYALIDKILAAPLLDVEKLLTSNKREEVTV